MSKRIGVDPHLKTLPPLFCQYSERRGCGMAVTMPLRIRRCDKFIPKRTDRERNHQYA